MEAIQHPLPGKQNTDCGKLLTKAPWNPAAGRTRSNGKPLQHFGQAYTSKWLRLYGQPCVHTFLLEQNAVGSNWVQRGPEESLCPLSLAWPRLWHVSSPALLSHLFKCPLPQGSSRDQMHLKRHTETRHFSLLRYQKNLKCFIATKSVYSYYESPLEKHWILYSWILYQWH